MCLVQGAALPGFDGALLRAPPGERGWGIIYNSGVTSKGRINFTLAHEFGHYLSHRLAFPDGIQCSQQDVVGGIRRMDRSRTRRTRSRRIF